MLKSLFFISILAMSSTTMAALCTNENITEYAWNLEIRVNRLKGIVEGSKDLLILGSQADKKAKCVKQATEHIALKASAAEKEEMLLLSTMLKEFSLNKSRVIMGFNYLANKTGKNSIHSVCFFLPEIDDEVFCSFLPSESNSESENDKDDKGKLEQLAEDVMETVEEVIGAVGEEVRDQVENAAATGSKVKGKVKAAINGLVNG